MNMLNVVINSQDDAFKAGLMELVILSQEMKFRVGCYHDKRSEAILAAGRQVMKQKAVVTRPANSPFVKETLEVFEKAADAEKDALEMIRHGFSHQNDWGMNWEEYYAFNTIVHRGVCQKLYKEFCKEYAKTVEREIESAEEALLDGR